MTAVQLLENRRMHDLCQLILSCSHCQTLPANYIEVVERAQTFVAQDQTLKIEFGYVYLMLITKVLVSKESSDQEKLTITKIVVTYLLTNKDRYKHQINEEACRHTELMINIKSIL